MKGDTAICIGCQKEFIQKSCVNTFCNSGCLKAYYKAGKNQVDRYKVLQRDGFKCFYCGASSVEDGVIIDVDHVIPSTAEGPNDISNMVCACRACNAEKGFHRMDEETELRVLKEVARRNEDIDWRRQHSNYQRKKGYRDWCKGQMALNKNQYNRCHD